MESGCPVRLNSIRQLSGTWLSPGLPAGSPYSGLLALLALLASLLELRKFSLYLECVAYGNPCACRSGTSPRSSGRYAVCWSLGWDDGASGSSSRCLRLLESFRLQEVQSGVKDALRLGALSFDAVKHLVLCRLEGRPPRLDLELYPYLPRVRVNTTSAGDYMTLWRPLLLEAVEISCPGPCAPGWAEPAPYVDGDPARPLEVHRAVHLVVARAAG